MQRQYSLAGDNALPALTVGKVEFKDGTSRRMECAVTMKLNNGASSPNFTFNDAGRVPGFILDPHRKFRPPTDGHTGNFCYWRKDILQQGKDPKTNAISFSLSNGTVVPVSNPAWALNRLNSVAVGDGPFNYVDRICSEVQDR
jgi:hypothetical protein